MSMEQPEFDKFAAAYDKTLGDTIPDGLNENGYFAEYKVALMASLAKSRRVARVLDFGCGAGRSLPYLKQYFSEAELWGYDVSPESLRYAAISCPDAKLTSDWEQLPSSGFDLIIAANVFHHIPLPERLPSLKRCNETLAPSGEMFLFEHNPYNPMTKWIFERCPFDSDAEMLTLKTASGLARQAGFRNEKHGYTLFFPKPLSFLRSFESRMEWLPLGAQYYVQMAR